MDETRPTYKQIAAYKLVYIHGCKTAEAAKFMHISNEAVKMLLVRLKKTNPQLFPLKHRRKPLRYIDNMDSQCKTKF